MVEASPTRICLIPPRKSQEQIRRIAWNTRSLGQDGMSGLIPATELYIKDVETCIGSQQQEDQQ